MQIKFKNESKKLLQETAKFPKELIFVGRNMNLVRSLNKKCGSEINRVNILAEHAV